MFVLANPANPCCYQMCGRNPISCGHEIEALEV